MVLVEVFATPFLYFFLGIVNYELAFEALQIVHQYNY